jgi:hypothetical protein
LPVDWVADGIRIFHLNGAEMQYALPKIEERQPGFLRRGYNVLAPAWELPRFPAEWAKEFNRFHEIWAPTAYVQEALQRAVSVPIFRLRNACEPHVATNLDKSYFGIPEDSFAILNFFRSPFAHGKEKSLGCDRGVSAAAEGASSV